MINSEMRKQIILINEKIRDDIKTCFDFKPYLRKIAEISYHYGFIEPKTDDDLPTRLYVFDGTCNADMNNWDW